MPKQAPQNGLHLRWRWRLGVLDYLQPQLFANFLPHIQARHHGLSLLSAPIISSTPCSTSIPATPARTQQHHAGYRAKFKGMDLPPNVWDDGVIHARPSVVWFEYSTDRTSPGSLSEVNGELSNLFIEQFCNCSETIRNRKQRLQDGVCTGYPQRLELLREHRLPHGQLVPMVRHAGSTNHGNAPKKSSEQDSSTIEYTRADRIPKSASSNDFFMLHCPVSSLHLLLHAVPNQRCGPFVLHCEMLTLTSGQESRGTCGSMECSTPLWVNPNTQSAKIHVKTTQNVMNFTHRESTVFNGPPAFRTNCLRTGAPRQRR